MTVRTEIFEVLDQASEAMAAKAIAEATSRPPASVRRTLAELRGDGHVVLFDKRWWPADKTPRVRVAGVLYRGRAGTPCQVCGWGQYTFHVCCPCCDATAQGIGPIGRTFGFRTIGGCRVAQARCRRCR